MAKSTKKVLLALSVVIIGGALGGWYWASGKTIATTERLITSLNGATHADGSSIKVAYESLQRTSFPSIGVRFVNPSIELNAPAPSTGAAPVSVLWKRTGTVDVVTDYLAHEYRVTSRGTGHLDMKSGDQTINAESTDSQIGLSLTANSYAAFNAWNALNFDDQQAVMAALKNVAAATVDMGPIELKDATTGNPIFSQEKATMKLANRSTDALVDFDLDTTIKGSLVSQAYNDIMMRAMRVMQPTMPLDLEAMPFSATRAGKQDVDLAMHVKMPKDTNGPMSNGTVTISRLSVKNDFYALQLPLNIQLSEASGERHALIKLDWMLDATPAGAAEMQHLIDTGIGMSPMMARAGADDKADMMAMKEKINAALPTVSTLGPVNLTLDFDVNVPVPVDGAPTPEGAKESLTIRSVALKHKRWSLEAAGHGEKVNKVGTTMDFKITCKQCEVMTADVLQTAQNVQDIFNMMSPGHPQAFVNESTLPKVNAMLSEVGTKDEAGDIVFIIKSAAPDDIRVNDKPYAEAMMKFMMAFMPPQPDPATAPVPMAAPVAAPRATPAPVQKAAPGVRHPAAKAH